MLLCQYKDILGEPSQGFHSARLFGLARNDLIGTVIGAWLLSYWRNWSFLKTLLVVFILGQILHWLFCVDTAFLKYEWL